MSGESGGMRTAALAALLLIAAPAGAADRSYTVTSFDRVRVDGPYQVTLKTDVSPFARANGSQAALDSVFIKVEGRTLIVRASQSSGWGGYPGEARGPVTIEVGTPELKTASINGAGALLIDKVKGLSFNVTIEGSGVLRIDAADVDQLRLGLAGAASSRIAGRAGMLNATVRGTSTLDADALRTKDAVIAAEGPALVRANVSGTAKVNAVGLASVALSGMPACESKAQGSANVSGCR